MGNSYASPAASERRVSVTSTWIGAAAERVQEGAEAGDGELVAHACWLA